MHIESNSHTGTYSIKIVDDHERDFLWNLRKTIKKGEVLKYHGAEELIINSITRRLGLSFQIAGNKTDRIVGSSNMDDHHLRQIDKVLTAVKHTLKSNEKDPGFIYVDNIWFGGLIGVKITLLRCSGCYENLIDLIDCRGRYCESCACLNRQFKDGIVNMALYSSQKLGKDLNRYYPKIL
jgi:hypothetical protein